MCTAHISVLVQLEDFLSITECAIETNAFTSLCHCAYSAVDHATTPCKARKKVCASVTAQGRFISAKRVGEVLFLHDVITPHRHRLPSTS
eukprot:276754-Amphidinium_carterae.1